MQRKHEEDMERQRQEVAKHEEEVARQKAELAKHNEVGKQTMTSKAHTDSIVLLCWCTADAKGFVSRFSCEVLIISQASPHCSFVVRFFFHCFRQATHVASTCRRKSAVRRDG